ncbi:MAG: spore germination protein, partial [Clostridia bacterium]|nr:spore germination protein [Clostridia bacterium]
MENIAKNRAVNLKEDLHNNDDIIVREIKFEDKGACLVFLDGIVDIEAINLSIIKSLNSFTTKEDNDNLDTILLRLNSVAGVEVLKTQDVIDKLLKGYAVLFVDDIEDAIGFNVIKYSSRSIEEPPTSMVIKGPREGFNESIKTNISLIRKRLLTKDLKIESFEIGEKTKTQVKIAYLVSIADDGIV